MHCHLCIVPLMPFRLDKRAFFVAALLSLVPATQAQPTAAVVGFGVESCAAHNDVRADGSDVHLPLQRCINSGATSVYLGADANNRTDYFIGSEGLTIPPRVRQFQIAPGACLVYSGRGTAILLNGAVRADHSVCVRRSVAEWDSAGPRGRDTTSIGLVVEDALDSTIRVSSASNFGTGVVITNAAQDVSGNVFFLSSIQDNQVGLRIRSKSPYGVNQNTFASLRVRINSSHCPAGKPVRSTSYLVLEAGSTNSNLFVNPNLEGECVEKALQVFSSGNRFLSPRFEASLPNSVEFARGTMFNSMYDPYTDNAAFQPVIQDLGSNAFVASFGTRGDTRGVAAPWAVITSNGRPVWQIGSDGRATSAAGFDAPPGSSSNIFAGSGGITVSSGDTPPDCSTRATGFLYVNRESKRLSVCIDGRSYASDLK